jgi:hypothetical protein
MTRTRSASKPIARQKPPFDAVATRSLKQMQAYGELVKSVRQTVDQFIKDNIRPGQGRDHMSDLYPDEFSKGSKGGGGARATEPKKHR